MLKSKKDFERSESLAQLFWGQLCLSPPSARLVRSQDDSLVGERRKKAVIEEKRVKRGDRRDFFFVSLSSDEAWGGRIAEKERSGGILTHLLFAFLSPAVWVPPPCRLLKV